MQPELSEMCISAANKPTVVLEMQAAPTASAVGFLSMSEAIEPALLQLIRYYLLRCFLLAVKLYHVNVTLTASRWRYVTSEGRDGRCLKRNVLLF